MNINSIWRTRNSHKILKDNKISSNLTKNLNGIKFSLETKL
jgi:hypothetical protein